MAEVGRLSVDDFIEQSIARGARDDLPELGRRTAAMVFLISEAEVYCANDGIDSFIERYGAKGVFEG